MRKGPFDTFLGSKPNPEPAPVSEGPGSDDTPKTAAPEPDETPENCFGFKNAGRGIAAQFALRFADGSQRLVSMAALTLDNEFLPTQQPPASGQRIRLGLVDQAGTWELTVEGRGMEKVWDMLRDSRLTFLREVSRNEALAAGDGETVITNILLEKLEDAE